MTFRNISPTLAAALPLFAALAPQAQAAYIITIQQDGSDVVATGSGSLNPTALGAPSSAGGSGYVSPVLAGAWVGPSSEVDAYYGLVGPSSFGTGGSVRASSITGDFTGIVGFVHALDVPAGYVPGTALSGTSTWSDETIADLGLTPGTYIWTWGTGEAADSFTVNIDSTSVPEPATLLILAGPAALLSLRRRRTV